jgi:hypothetical protein
VLYRYVRYGNLLAKFYRAAGDHGDSTRRVHPRSTPCSIRGPIRCAARVPTVIGMLMVLIVAALIVVMIVRRLAGEPLRIKQMLIIPVVLAGLGIHQLAGTRVTGGMLTYLAVGSVVAAGLGLVRGMTVAVYERNGVVWMRYRPLTIAIWVLSVAVRGGMTLAARSAGVHLPAETTMLLAAVSLLAEAAMIAPKALGTGAAFATSGRGRTLRSR